MGDVLAVPVLPVEATPVPVAVAMTVALLDGELYGIERTTTAAAGATEAEVTAAEVTPAGELVEELEEELEVANVVDAEDDGVTERAEDGVPAGQSEAASDGASQGMT